MAENLKNSVSLYSEIVEVNGKHYKLQHPGNRAWLKLKQSLVNITTKEFDFEKLLDSLKTSAVSKSYYALIKK